MPGETTSTTLSHADRGRIGARRRWGPLPRVIRLDALTAEQVAVVLALVNAAKSAKKAADDAAA